MRYAGRKYFAIAAAGLIASVFLADAAAAQQIPPLAKIPPAIAKTHPELVSRRAALAKERDALHAQFDQHNRDCTSVEEGSPQDTACIAGQKRLSAALDRHIAASQAFNASFGSDIVEPGDVLKDSLNNNQSSSAPGGNQNTPQPNPQAKPKPGHAQVFKTESQCQAEFKRRDRPCRHPDYTDAKCENAALEWKLKVCEAHLPADGWGR